MSFQLWLRPRPRSLILTSSTHALTIRSPDTPSSGGDPTTIVEFTTVEELDFAGLIKVNQRGKIVGGVLGLISVPCEATSSHETFLVLISSSTVLPSIIPPTTSLTISKILSVEFHCVSSSFWDDPSLVPSSSANYGSGSIGYDDLDDVNNVYSGHGYRQSSSASSSRPGTPQSSQIQPNGQILPHPCAGVRNYLSTGTFYYSTSGTFDLSKRLSVWERYNGGEKEEVVGMALDGFDDRFVWNSNILSPLLSFRQTLPPTLRQSLSSSLFLIPIIQGFCSIHPIGSGPMGIVHVGLISRLGWKRAGARYKTRGIDDNGDVANFVETETILTNEEYCASYVQLRGSLPVFWEQQGNQTFNQTMVLTRPQAASQPAFDKHFMDLIAQYQSVHIINLLGTGNEAALSDAYTRHTRSLISTLKQDADHLAEAGGDVTELSITAYDFHANVKAGGYSVVKEDFARRLRDIVKDREKFGFDLIDLRKGAVVLRQAGVFRTNCLDCLDRTNYVEDVLSTLTVAAVQSMGLVSTSSLAPSVLEQASRTLWADNGDALSKIYAGTGALNTSITRGGKKTFASLLSDASKSVGRAIQAQFGDDDKQQSIDMLLGLYSGQKAVTVWNPIAQAVQHDLVERIDEYSTPKEVTIFAGTWNLAGKSIGDVEPWLFPTATSESDLYVVCFQEIVPLNAQQIVNTDPEARRRCEAVLLKAFARKGSFVSLRSEQLVGSAIFIVVRDTLIPAITKVEGASRKTGLRGMSGNKGGIGIRFNLYDTTLCFMTAHLAAGLKAIEERNADYRTISSQLTFQRGRMIDEHDIVIWAGDFNYRIDLDNATVRDLAEMDDFHPLWEADQLRVALLNKETFQGYEEGQIGFRPTYKYDFNSTEYDSGEKQRIPAWTDRILFKGKGLRQRKYSRSEILTSDHRPVYSLFTTTVRQVNQSKRSELLEKLTSSEQDRLGGAVSKNGGADDVLIAPKPRRFVSQSGMAGREPRTPMNDRSAMNGNGNGSSSAGVADLIDLQDVGVSPVAKKAPPPRPPVSASSSRSITSGVTPRAIPPPPTHGRAIPAPMDSPSLSTSLVDDDFVRIRLSSPPSSTATANSTKPPLPSRSLPPPLPQRTTTIDSLISPSSNSTSGLSPLGGKSPSRSTSVSSLASSHVMVQNDTGGSASLAVNGFAASKAIVGGAGIGGGVAGFSRRAPPPPGVPSKMGSAPSSGGADKSSLAAPPATASTSTLSSSPSSTSSTPSSAIPSSSPPTTESETRFTPRASTLAILNAARASPVSPTPEPSASAKTIPPRPSPKPSGLTTSKPAASASEATSPRAEALAEAIGVSTAPAVKSSSLSQSAEMKQGNNQEEEEEERPLTVAERMKKFQGGEAGTMMAAPVEVEKKKPVIPAKPQRLGSSVALVE